MFLDNYNLVLGCSDALRAIAEQLDVPMGHMYSFPFRRECLKKKLARYLGMCARKRIKEHVISRLKVIPFIALSPMDEREIYTDVDLKGIHLLMLILSDTTPRWILNVPFV